MTSAHRNRLVTTVSAVAGSGLGAFTISTASSGYRTFVAGDDGLSFDGILITEGTTWERRDGCVYTHSGTSLARGTLMDSSTGSAITFTTAAIVSQGNSAELANRIESAALNVVISSADAAVTMLVGTLHVLDISGYTANRTATLPAVAAVGDRCGLVLQVGDADFELLYTATSGDTLICSTGSVAGGTEASRLFITGERVIFRCIVANTTWIVENDGRIPMKGLLRLSTSTNATETTATYYYPTDRSGVWTADRSVGDICTTSNGRITARRACVALCAANNYQVNAIPADKYFVCSGEINASNVNTLYGQTLASVSNALPVVTPVIPVTFATDDYIRMRYFSNNGSLGCFGGTANLTTISFTEQL